MKTVAFVPLRLNSQRVAGKNLRLLGVEPLMCHILRTLAGIGEIDEVYAYCSDERICEYLPHGVRFLRRSPGLDRDTTLGREIYDSFTADVEADLYVLAHATSPFIRAETVADALRHVRSGEYDSAFSAEKIQPFAWFEGRPLNYALDALPRTQAAHFSFSRARSGAASGAASGRSPTWPSSTASKGWTSTTPRISRWPRSSRQAGGWGDGSGNPR